MQEGIETLLPVFILCFHPVGNDLMQEGIETLVFNGDLTLV
jgi:hypothetical protein